MRYLNTEEDVYPNTREGLLEEMSKWRNDDHNDWLLLRRHEVILLLEGK